MAEGDIGMDHKGCRMLDSLNVSGRLRRETEQPTVKEVIGKK